MNKYKKINKKIIMLLIGFVALIFYIINVKKESNLEITALNNISNINENQNLNETNTLEEEKNEIVVHITGAIKQEGVYKLEENSRLTDIVELAGGLREDADMSKINLALILEDGMKINIPSINENLEESEDKVVENTIDINKSENNKTKKININTASKEELDTLPGIGEATAQKIIEYRNKNGKFSNIEEIKEVSGIGDSKFEKIKDYIKV